jgi:2-oxoglutarate dehydrogenase E1 component
MNFITENQAKIEPLDSLLSEAAVLGFEYGYSIADPVTLVVWEAQFGDFANAAQVIIDNFIASSYSKWQLPNDVVMLLPHGQEGQGPEHSSARLERYLLLCADDNMYVCNPTTPAQYFHLLRRHSKSQANAPLIVMTPKSLLRHPDARSKKDEFINGKFNEILDDETVSKETADRIILTSGKVFYDVLKYKRENNMDKVALVRIEQYYPFKEEKIKSILASYENAKDVIWLQEEPANMGAQTFLAMRLQRSISKKQNLSFVSRRESSSTAPGSNKKFQATQKELIERAFKG